VSAPPRAAAPDLWTPRVAARLGIGPGAVAVAAAVALFGAWLAAESWLFGFSPAAKPWFGADSWAELALRAALFGYTLVLPWIGRRSALRAWGDLAGDLEGPPGELDALHERIAHVDARRLRAAGALGVLVNLVVNVPGAMPRILHEGGASGIAWDIGWFALLGWLLFRALAADLLASRVFSDAGARRLRLDLLDQRPARPLVGWGLRTVLHWAVWFFVVQLFWIGPEHGNPANAAALVPLLAVAVGGLLLPVQGVHRRLADAKQRELARLDAAIRTEREALAATSRSADAHLANLAALRGVVSEARTWPFDVSTYLRFSLYLLLGLGSWLGGALVEWVVDRLLAG
jgi:hypothetical protein